MSSLEDKLLGDQYNISDPFLEICNLEINNRNRNRYNITLCIGIIYVIIFAIILYMDIRITNN